MSLFQKHNLLVETINVYFISFDNVNHTGRQIYYIDMNIDVYEVAFTYIYIYICECLHASEIIHFCELVNIYIFT